MTSHYDAIVVGGGLGGLAAAATLAKGGRSVRLFERHGQPGGYATTFVREGYEFEVSLHALSGIGDPGHRGGLWPILKHLGIHERVEFLPIEPLYRSIAPGLDLRVPRGWEPALECFCEAFPHERAGFQRLFAQARRIHQQAQEATRMGNPSAVDALTRFPALAHAAMVPVSALLDDMLHDPLAKLAFCQLWGYFGLPPEQLSLVYFLGGVGGYLEWGAWYPKGKSQALSNAFAAVIEESGGRVSLGVGVQQILVSGGKVTGVVTDEGERLSADVVVSNASPLTTCTDLIGVDNVPSDYLRRLAVGRVSLGTNCVYLGLDKDAASLGMQDHEVFVNDSADIASHYRAYLGLGRSESFLATCYDVTDPDFSRPGHASVVLVELSSGEAWARLSPADYPDAKSRVAEDMVARADRLYPGLRDAVEVAVVATPLTNMRYTGNPGGAIYGFANTPDQNPAWRVGHKGPLKGLWFVGAWTQPGGGYEPSMASGYLAARRILGH